MYGSLNECPVASLYLNTHVTLNVYMYVLIFTELCVKLGGTLLWLQRVPRIACILLYFCFVMFWKLKTLMILWNGFNVSKYDLPASWWNSLLGLWSLSLGFVLLSKILIVRIPKMLSNIIKNKWLCGYLFKVV